MAPIALPLALTFAIQAAVTVALYSAPVIAPAAASAFGMPVSAVGYFITAAYVGSMIGTVAAGGWLARLGPIRVSQLGLATCLAGLTLAVAAASVPARGLSLSMVALGALVVGLGYGPTTPASSVMLARAAPPSQFSLIFSIKQTGVPAGAALGGALLPTMILLVGWRWSALAIGIGCALLALAVQPVRSRYDVNLDPSAQISVRRAFMPAVLVLRNRGLREMALASFFFSGVQISVITYLVAFMMEGFGLSLVVAGLVMAASQVASAVGRIVWGMLADRARSRRAVLGVLGMAMGVAAAGTLLASPAWPRWALFAFAAVFGATGVGWNGVYLAEVARVAPAGRTSEATGGCLFFAFLGVVITPLIFNFLLGATGSYGIPYAVSGACAFAMGARLFRNAR